MNEQLIIRLPATPEAKVVWLILDDTSAVIASGTLDSVAELGTLTEKASTRELRVFAATSGMSFHQVDLPAKSRRQAPQVVPFALEDEVAQDLESLHFAWPEHVPADEPLPVCVVAKQQLTFWLESLKQAGLTTTALYADMFLLPYEANHWSVAQFEEEYVVRQAPWFGIALEPEWLGYASFEEQELPVGLIAAGEVSWQHPPAPIQSGDDLALMGAKHFNPRAAINLLQGEFVQKESVQTDWSMLKWPAIAAAVLFAFSLMNGLATSYQLNREAAQLQAAMEANYFSVFADERRYPPNARQRLEAEVAALSGGGEAQLLSLLSDLAPAFQEANLTLTVLQYDQARGELRLQANGANFQMFERFQRSARANQLTVEQGQLVSRGGQIAGTLTIRRSS